MTHGDVPSRPLPLRRLTVGFPHPVDTTLNGAITAGLAQYGGVDTRNMWGMPQLGRWKWHDPDVHVQLLADNNTRLWVFSPSTLACSDPAAMIGYCDQAQGSNRTFYQHYRSVGGHNGHFDFPTSRQPRLGHVVGTAGRDVRRTRHHHQVGTRFGHRVRPAAAGTLEGCSTRNDDRRSSKVVGNVAVGSCRCGPADRMFRADDVMATIGMPTSETDGGARSGRCAAAGTAAAQRRSRTR